MTSEALKDRQLYIAVMALSKIANLAPGTHRIIAQRALEAMSDEKLGKEEESEHGTSSQSADLPLPRKAT